MGGGAGSIAGRAGRAALSRRSVLACLAGAAVWGVARAGEPQRRVLFIGNSFTHQHDVPRLVTARAARAGRPIRPHVIVRNGALLAGHLRRRVVRETIGWGWEAVVLQPHSTEALFEDRAAALEEAVAQAVALAPGARLVLFAPWPRAEGHSLYAAAGAPGYAAPRSPTDMARATMGALSGVGRRRGVMVAPVAAAWVAAMAQGVRLHADDGYHANADGANLAATVLWESLATVLP